MGLFGLEHGTRAYQADFALYGTAVAALGGTLLVAAPAGQVLQLAGLAGAGLLCWSALEYGLHRFLLHGVRPFSRWHGEHHRRPMALICTPTVLTAALFAGFVVAPAFWIAAPWQACALTLGVLTGYLAYAVTHHAIHHWGAPGAWLRARKVWHAGHHQGGAAGCYGVTSTLWDHVFGTAQAPRFASAQTPVAWPPTTTASEQDASLTPRSDAQGNRK